MAKHGKIAQRILKIQQELDDKKSNRSELKGQLKAAENQLKEFKVSNPENIPVKIQELTDEIEKVDRLLEEKTEAVERLFKVRS